MEVSIIGAGNVGIALARGFTARGQRVTLGVPDPTQYAQEAALLGTQAPIVSTSEAIATGQIVILAVPYSAALQIAADLSDWGGRILVDATNPIAPGMAGLLIGNTSSGAESIASRAHNARVVKAFNTTGAENMADSRYPDGKVFMPICGDDADARAQMLTLARLIGFDAVDMGELNVARYIEPFAMAWIHLAIKRGAGRRFAFARLAR